MKKKRDEKIVIPPAKRRGSPVRPGKPLPDLKKEASRRAARKKVEVEQED